MGVPKNILGPQNPPKNVFLGSKKWKKLFFSRNLTSVISLNIGGGSPSGLGQLGIRLVILKSKSFLNVAYRYFQCRMMLLMRINKNFSSKLIPRVSVFSLVVLLKVE